MWRKQKKGRRGIDWLTYVIGWEAVEELGNGVVEVLLEEEACPLNAVVKVFRFVLNRGLMYGH